jgi:transcriptional regulator with XRE-family HTH domain
MTLLDLKIEIIRKQWRQADVAVSCGLHPSRLCRIVNGRVKPSASELNTLLDVLGLLDVPSAVELAGDDGREHGYEYVM